MTMQTFVAREQELAQLNECLDRALAGQGAVVFITGEAGAGKTALVTEFACRAQNDHADLLVAIGGCNAQTGIGDPYLPFREVLSLLTGDVESRMAQGAITQENAGRLQDFLRVSGRALVEYGPDLIDIFVPGGALATRVGARLARRTGWLDRLQELTEQKAAGAGGGLQQSRLFEQYTDVLQALAGQRPLMLVVDDLQWVDVSSASLLFHLGRRIGEGHILMVGTYRPADVALGRGGERHPLEDVTSELKRYYGDIWIHLGRATEAEGRQFVDALLDTEPNLLRDAFRQTLFQHTGGHPLFTVELLRDMQERGQLVQDEQGRWIEGPALDWRTLPARVEGVIEKRIGRLEEQLRETLTIASVEGEDFTAQVIARIQEVSERQLVRRLTEQLDKKHRLVWEEGIERVGRQRLSLYRFRHNLFQRYLYNNLGQTQREFLHEDVGNVLEELYGDQTEKIAVQLARHFREAGITEKAVDYLCQAGERAIRLSAHEEAIGHLTKGLALLKILPVTLEIIQQELTLQMALGVSLKVTKGYGAPELEQAYARARDLCRQIASRGSARGMGQAHQLFPVLHGLHRFYFEREEYQTAQELEAPLLRLAQHQQDPGLLLEAHEAVGTTLFSLGEFAPAREHPEKGIAFYDPQQHHSHIFRYGGGDPGMSGQMWAAITLWHLGYPDQALKRSQEALALAQELSHPFSLAYSLSFAAGIRQHRREGRATQELAEAAIALSTEQEFAYWLAVGTILRGWALAEQGRGEAGIAQMHQGLAARRVTAGVFRPHFSVLLAETYGKLGQAEEGLSVLREVEATAQKSGGRYWEANLYRLKGELLLIQSEAESRFRQAESCFQHALEVARRQSAKSLELRTVVSLSRLWQKQGKQEEAQQMLAEIYNWFTEGFDTADLKEARLLLQQGNHQ